MANVFSDIFEAIRIIRQKKGTREIDIMTYVHDRLGKDVTIRTVLKTMKTLNRLVDDGLLIKKGCRYMLPLPSEKVEEKKKEDEDDCMDDDEDDEDDECMEDEEEEAEEDEDEDEDDDCMDDEEDEAEEDEEDDDDDDDDCMKDDEDEKNGDGDDDEDARKCNFEEEMKGMKGMKGKENGSGNGNGSGNKREDKDPCKMEKDSIDIRGRRNEDAELNNKHIDSKMKKYMKSELNPVAGSFIRSKKQRHVSRRNQVYDEEYDELSNTGSPMRKSSVDIDLIMDVEEGLHESAGGAQFINSDLSFGYEERDSPEGFVEYRYKSPNGPPPPDTPRVHFERKESCCSDTVPKVDDNAQGEQDDAKSKEPEDGGNKPDRQLKRRAGDEGEEVCKEKVLKQDESEDKLRDDKRSSICRLCKKKKPPEHNVD